MEAITIEAASRETGKRAAKAVRRAGNVPCVLYGHHTEPVTFQVGELDLRPLIYTSDLHVVKIQLDGNEWECIMKDVTFHPVTDHVTHADFQVLEQGSLVTLTVPVQYHGTPVGQKEGGDTQFLTHELEIRCLPKDIPSHIDVEVGPLAIGDSIHVGDLDVPGVEFIASDDRTIVTVVPPRMLEEELEEEVELGVAEAADTAEEEGGEEPVEQTEE